MKRVHHAPNALCIRVSTRAFIPFSEAPRFCIPLAVGDCYDCFWHSNGCYCNSCAKKGSSSPAKRDERSAGRMARSAAGVPASPLLRPFAFVFEGS